MRAFSPAYGSEIQMPEPEDLLARFRRLALSLPDAAESAHMGAPDFRLHGQIFATLSYAVRGLATLKLSPEQQAHMLRDLPGSSKPAPGGWGRMGMTLIHLDAPEPVLAGALHTAHSNLLTRQRATAAKRHRPASTPRRRLQ